jgi:DNA topoisomerase-1
LTPATTLILTEKPDAAFHVAEALSRNGKPKRLSVEGVSFFEVFDNNERILICSALGHLYAVATEGKKSRSQYPVWDFTWKPKHIVERGQFRQEKWIRAISVVSKEADRFVNGCDYDLEGSVIGYTILKYACNGADKNAYRMKFSTLTSKELREAYSKLSPRLDCELVQAGMCRHEVDWLYGINLSRALTQSAMKASHRYSTLSTGRVQGPTMNFVVEREREIQCFVPVPYWILRTLVTVDGRSVEADFEIERMDNRDDAQHIVNQCRGKTGVLEKVESRTYDLAPPTPFDLSTLQAEAYRHFGFTPRYVLAIAEHLYLGQLISYPRTSSQKLPATIGYAEVIRSLNKLEPYRKETARLLSFSHLTPSEGKKDDPAHPAVYPTGAMPRRMMDAREQKLFDLIVRRFLSTFGEAAIRQSDKAIIRIGEYRFYIRASRVLSKGWIEFYGRYAKFDDAMLPSLKVGQEIPVKEIHLEQKYTQPPPRFNPSSLLKLMEEAEIGTKATRADIIETLYERGYVKQERNSIAATSLAFRVSEILMKYCPKIIDVKFTRELEAMMEQIELGKENRQHVVHSTIEYLKPVLEDLKAREAEIGSELTTTMGQMQDDKVTLRVPCPKCGLTLIWITGKNGKRFIGHKIRAQCTFSLPLPPTRLAELTFLQTRCPECGFQMVQVKWKRRKWSRPMVSCPNCYVNKPTARKPEITLTSTREESVAPKG